MNEPNPAAASDRGDRFDETAQLEDLGISVDEIDAAIAELETTDLGLSALWAIPDGLEDRVVDKAWRKIHNRRSAVAFGELLGLGWRTTKHLIDPTEGQS